MYNTADFYWYCSSTRLHWTKTTSATSRVGIISPSFVLSIKFPVLPYNFIVEGVFNSSLYQSFVLNTNLLLVLLMLTWVLGIAVNVSKFFNMFDIILKIWGRIRIIWSFKCTMGLLFLINFFFWLFSYIFPRATNKRAISLFEFLKSNLCDKLRI